jgi:hypothetical protein
MALAEHPHGRALHLYARGPIEMRRQFFLGPVGSVKLTPLGTIVHPRLDGRRQRLGNTAPLARCPWDLSTGQTTCRKLLEPQPHGGAMYLKILGNRLTLPPAMGHHDRLAPVTESSVMGRFEDRFQLRLCRCRQPDPPHLFPPLVKSCPRGYLKKDARSSAACIRRLPHSDYIEGSSYPYVHQMVSTGDDAIVAVTRRLQCCTDLLPQRPPGVLMDRGHIRTTKDRAVRSKTTSARAANVSWAYCSPWLHNTTSRLRGGKGRAHTSPCSDAIGRPVAGVLARATASMPGLRSTPTIFPRLPYR